MKKLAIIGAGQMAKIIAIRAKEMGNIETYCFAWEKGAVAKDYVDFFVHISVTEKEQICEYCSKVGIHGVVASSGVALVTAAYIAEQLGLIGNALSVAQEIRNKYRNREKIKGVTEFRHPFYQLVSQLGEIDAENLPYPVILKPVSEGGKRGVIVVKDRQHLDSAFVEASAASKCGQSKVIIEEYIQGGKEYSVESLSYKGKNYIIQITEKVSSGPPHCVELAHHQPANIDRQMRKRVEIAMDKALSAIGLLNGPCHSEIKIMDGQIYVIEFNARLGGDHISYPLTELSSGYPLISGVIQIALDEFEQPDLSKCNPGFAGVCFITKQTEHMKELFSNAEKYSWCWKKNKVSDELKTLTHNDGFNTNYIIYYSKDGIPQEIEELL